MPNLARGNVGVIFLDLKVLDCDFKFISKKFGLADPFSKAINESMKIIVTLCDPIHRMVSDFVHTTETNEPHAKKIKTYAKIEDYVMDWLPHVEEKLKNEGDEYLTNLYYHDITASILTNG